MPSRIDQKRSARKRKRLPAYSTTHFRKTSPPNFVPAVTQQTHHAGRQHSKLFKLFVFVIVTVVGTSLLGLWLVMSQSENLNSTENIVFVPSNLDQNTGNIILAHLSPSDAKIEVGIFSADMPVNIFGGYGTYPLRSVFPLLTLDKKSPEFIRAAYSYALQLPISEVVSVNQLSLLSSAHLNDLWWQLLTYKLHSQLNFTQRLSVYRFTQRVGLAETHQIQDQNDWQSLTNLFGFSAVSPDCAVAVLNTTDVAGSGLAVSQVLENSGIPVIRLTDTPNELQTTQILTSQGTPFCQEVLDQLGSVFPFSTHVQVDPSTMNTYRANLVILIGQDFAQEFGRAAH